MKQTKFTTDEYAFNDMRGIMPSLYKKEVEKYKNDVAHGVVKAPVFPEDSDKPKKKEMTIEYYQNKATEQKRLTEMIK